MCSQHYRSYMYHGKSKTVESVVAFGRHPPELWYYKNSTYMTCNVGCTWLIYSLCVALYGFYAGYVWPSVTISGSIRIGIVTTYQFWYALTNCLVRGVGRDPTYPLLASTPPRT